MKNKKLLLILTLLFTPIFVVMAGGIGGNPFSGDHRMSSAFGPRSSPGGIGSTCHKGMDFATPIGTPLLSTIDGTVTTAGSVSGYGNTVVVTSTTGNYSVLYGHMDGVNVGVGNPVTAGTNLGPSGNTGNSTGPHLHYEIRVTDPSTGEPLAVNPALVTPGMNLDDPSVRAALIAQSRSTMDTGDGCDLIASDPGAGGEPVPPGSNSADNLIGCDDDISEQTTDRVDALMQQQFEAANSVITQPTPVEQLTCFDQTTEIFSEIGGIHSDPQQGNIDDSIVPAVQQPLMQQLQQFLTGNVAGGINDIVNQAFGGLTSGLGGGGAGNNCDMQEQAWLISQCIEMPQIPSLGDILGGQMGEIMGTVGGVVGALGNPERMLEQVCSMANSALQGSFGNLNSVFENAANNSFNPITDTVGGN